MELVFASANPGKIKEIHQLLGNSYIIKGLKDVGITEEIPETGNTFYENAFQKANYVYQKFKCNVFADDSGLEVAALNNRPGVYSAIYAGLPKSDKKNIELLLQQLQGIKNRKARFITVICLIVNDQTHYFEGTIEGTIAEKPFGNNGFGYDPVFIPDGYNQTFAELSDIEKNKISHRFRALEKMKIYLESIKPK